MKKPSSLWKKLRKYLVPATECAQHWYMGRRWQRPKALGGKKHMLFSAVRLALQLMIEDPLLFFYIRGL